MNLRYLLSFMRILKIPGLFPILRDWQALVRMHCVLSASMHDRGMRRGI
jgi:hypothetical protein